MKHKNSKTTMVDTGRRKLLRLASAGTLAGAISGLGLSASGRANAQETKTVRWGIVGTGGITICGFERQPATPVGRIGDLFTGIRRLDLDDFIWIILWAIT